VLTGALVPHVAALLFEPGRPERGEWPARLAPAATAG